MDLILRLFDLFNESAKKLSEYVPQSGSDLILLFQKLVLVGNSLEVWISDNIGVNLRIILANIGRLVILGLNLIFEAVRQIAGRL